MGEGTVVYLAPNKSPDVKKKRGTANLENSLVKSKALNVWVKGFALSKNAVETWMTTTAIMAIVFKKSIE